MLGEYLRKQRIKRLLTQDQVAKMIGITKTYYSLLETNRTKPGMKTIRKISEIYNISSSYIVRLINEDNK